MKKSPFYKAFANIAKTVFCTVTHMSIEQFGPILMFLQYIGW